MTLLSLYTSFHLNLKFSSIPEEQYPIVIEHCYWPALDLLSQFKKISLGFELSGFTLETINRLDPEFVRTLRKFHDDGRCEIIGSGYSQAIFPLIPAKVNLKNLEIGNDIYQNFLGVCPKTAYVNEQTYSSGLVEIYKRAGYENLIMDWDNPAKYNKYPYSYQYHPVIAEGTGNSDINLIWNNSVSFQKFQRYAHGVLSFEDYVSYLKSHYSPSENRSFLLYGNDLEIFDYRPGKEDLLFVGNKENPEFSRIVSLFEYLEDSDIMELITPSKVVEKFRPGEVVRLESPECPIPCKKQDKYNVTRWAVTGRDDSKNNSTCYKIFNQLELIEIIGAEKKIEQSEIGQKNRWKTLSDLWSSDYRTHTTDQKYRDFLYDLGNSVRDNQNVLDELFKKYYGDADFILQNPQKIPYEIPFEVEALFDEGRYHEIPDVFIDGNLVKSQAESIKYYRDGSLKSCRFIFISPCSNSSLLSGKFGPSRRLKDESSNYLINKELNIVKTPEVEIEFSPMRGGTIKSLKFPGIDSQTLVGELSHGFFKDVSYSPDWYSGNTTIFNRLGEKYTDLGQTSMIYPDSGSFPVRIPVSCKVSTPIGNIWKVYYVYINSPRVDIRYYFSIRKINPLSFRFGTVTFNPDAFDQDTLFYSTINGGFSQEKYMMKGTSIFQDNPVNPAVSCSQCLGATDGWVRIGDKDKSVIIASNYERCYSVPLLHYEEFSDSYFLRVQHSLCERDETAEILIKGHNQGNISLIGQKNNLLSENAEIVS